MTAVKVAVVGANGFVGRQICKALESDARYCAVPVIRGDSLSLLAQSEIVVHAANPARRFRAESNPEMDFEETVEKTSRILRAAASKRFLLVSSFSCRTQMHTNYGRNRRSCELLALGQGAAVVRLGPMFGGGRTQDSLHDLLAGKPVHVAPETRYAYVDVAWAGRKIVEMMDGAAGTLELAAGNAVSVAELRDRFGSTSTFSGPDDTQVPQMQSDGPDAKLVFEFAGQELKRIDQWR